MKTAMVRAVALMWALVLPHGVLAGEDNPTSSAKAALPGEADFCQAYVRALREKDPTSLEELFHPISRETLHRKISPDKRSSMERRLNKVIPVGEASCRFTPVRLVESFEGGGFRYRVQDLYFIFPVAVTHDMAVYVQTAEKAVLIGREAVRLETGRLFLVNFSGSGTDRQSQEFRHFKDVFDIVERNYVEHVDGSRLLKRAGRGMIEVSGLAAHVKDGLLKEGDTPSSAHPTPKTIDALLTMIKIADPGADDAKLFDGAIRGMLKDLDKHSAYLDRNELNDVYAKQKMAAIGVDLAKKGGAIEITSVARDSAAGKGGLASGDIVESIDGVQVTENETVAGAAARLRGWESTRSTAYVTVRTTDGQRVPKRFVRETAKSDSVQSQSIRNGVAYVRIRSFESGTPSVLKRALADLRSETGAPSGFVLDLRHNQGGLLQAAVAVADEFLAAGRVATIAGRNSQPMFVFDATPNIDYPEREALPMVVLVDEFTASGAEIVAAALQDHRRAVVAGSRTIGMTSIQTLFPLLNGGALKLTTGHFVRVAPSADESVVPDACSREGKVTLVTSPTADRDTSCPKSTIQPQPPEQDPLVKYAVDYLESTGGRPGH